MSPTLFAFIWIAPFLAMAAAVVFFEWHKKRRHGPTRPGVAKNDGNDSLVTSSYGGHESYSTVIRVPKDPARYTKAMMPKGKTK